MTKRIHEARFRSEVVKMLSSVGAFPVENSVHVGVPDVHCTLGWLELKISDVPNFINSVPSVDLRSTQRIWLKNWSALGGKAWTLTRFNLDVGSMRVLYLMHRADWAADYLGRKSMQDHFDSAILNTQTLNTVSLIRAMRSKNVRN